MSFQILEMCNSKKYNKINKKYNKINKKYNKIKGLTFNNYITI